MQTPRVQVPAKGRKRPGEPRQPDTAYTFFWKSKRKQVMAESPHLSGPLVSREVGRLWKTLSAEDRKVWDDMAEKDKMRFQQEMAQYVPPTEDDTAAALVKPIKDPYAPKPARTGFQLFMNHNRESFALVHMSLNEFRAEMSQVWKRMSDKDKAKWYEMAQQDQARYEKELKAYKPPAYLSTTAVRATSRLDELKKLAKGDPNAPRLPATAYSFFLSSNKRGDIQQEQPNLKHNEVMREVGVSWKSLSDKDRKPFIAQADQDVERFKLEMEMYLLNSQKEALGLSTTAARKGVKRGRSITTDPVLLVSSISKTSKSGKLVPPRRPQTAYNLMYMSKRAEVMATYQISHNECSALCGRIWRQMSNAEREPFKRMANEEKLRYAAELKAYRAKVEGQKNSNPAKKSSGFRCFADSKRRESRRLTSHDISSIWSSMPEPHQVVWEEVAADKEQGDQIQQPMDKDAEAEQRQLEENACAILAARELHFSLDESNSANVEDQHSMFGDEAHEDDEKRHYPSYMPNYVSDAVVGDSDEREQLSQALTSTPSRRNSNGFVLYVGTQLSQRADWTESMWVNEWESLSEEHRRYWELRAREHHANLGDRDVDQWSSSPRSPLHASSGESSAISHSDDEETGWKSGNSNIDVDAISGLLLSGTNSNQEAEVERV